MSTAYNVLHRILQGSKADRSKRVAPAAGGVIKVSPVGLATVVFSVTGARTIESASNFEPGDSLFCFATVSGVTVNSVVVSDGGFVEFIVSLNASGVKQWVVASSTELVAQVQGANLVAIPLATFRVFDAFQTNLPAPVADDSDDLGLFTPTIGTTAPSLRSVVTNATVTQRGAVIATVPANYEDGDALSVVIPWTRTDAATTSATLDLVAFRTAAPTVDVCSTAAQDINSAASGTATFVLTPTNIVAGEQILLRVDVAVVDGTSSQHDLTSIGWSFTV